MLESRLGNKQGLGHVLGVWGARGNRYPLRQSVGSHRMLRNMVSTIRSGSLPNPLLTIVAERGPSGDQEEIREQAMGDILDDDFGEEGEYCPSRSPSIAG